MVIEIGRLQFLVTSATRRMTPTLPGEPWRPMCHLVDFEPELDDEGKLDALGEPYKCSCEAFNLRGMRPCRHCVEVFEYLLPIVQHLRHWQPRSPEPKSPPAKKREYKIQL